MKIESDAQIILFKHDIACKMKEITKLMKENQELKQKNSEQLTNLNENHEEVSLLFN